MKPLIGITCGEIINHAKPWAAVTQGQADVYINAVIDAGGVPIVIPLIDDSDALRHLCERLDGLMFAGGNDIDPVLYGQEPHPRTYDISPRRDKVEVQLMNWALDDDMPLLAICRGAQLLNVVRGGTLYQDIEAEIPNADDHDYSYHDPSGTHLSHRLKVEPSSRLCKIIGSDSIRANSHHHQAIGEVGDGLVAAAWAEDGIIEAIELPLSKFSIGIQCHLEEITQIEPKWQSVFNAFVRAAT